MGLVAVEKVLGEDVEEGMVEVALGMKFNFIICDYGFQFKVK